MGSEFDHSDESIRSFSSHTASEEKTGSSECGTITVASKYVCCSVGHVQEDILGMEMAEVVLHFVLIFSS